MWSLLFLISLTWIVSWGVNLFFKRVQAKILAQLFYINQNRHKSRWRKSKDSINKTKGFLFVVLQWPAQVTLDCLVFSWPWNKLYPSVWYFCVEHTAQMEGQAQTGGRFIQMRQCKARCWYFGGNWVIDLNWEYKNLRTITVSGALSPIVATLWFYKLNIWIKCTEIRQLCLKCNKHSLLPK